MLKIDHCVKALGQSMVGSSKVDALSIQRNGKGAN